MRSQYKSRTSVQIDSICYGQIIQSQKIAALKNKRSQPQVDISLEKIRSAAVEERNLLPTVIEAVENWCTLGEIADTLRKVFGEYR